MPYRETQIPPAVVFEDADLLVVHKPAGWNTHAPAPHANEGIYEWFKHREPRWARLSILHRLDKETSGLLVFGKTTAANQSLTRQFTERAIEKRYILRTDRPVPRDSFTVQSRIVRVGDRYEGRPGEPDSNLKVGGGRGIEVGEWAETQFAVINRAQGYTEVEARPITGRTHQIRVHAASEGFPILGDTLYGGTPFTRVCLASVELGFEHPVGGQSLEFRAPADFDTPPSIARRRALFQLGDAAETTAFRTCHGAGDGSEPGRYVDRLGAFRLIQSANPDEGSSKWSGASGLGDLLPEEGVYLKRLNRHVRQSTPAEAAPQWLAGLQAPERFVVRENGVNYELAFNEGYSVGLFLDQRDNRRRLLVNHIGADFTAFGEENSGPREVLNTFAYTCAFSVCAALGGAKTTSLDLSRKYLDWGRRNFELNGLDPAAHDFIFGDCFEWMRRLAKKGRLFDAVLLDPPTFSRSKEHGDFRTESDYGDLVSQALALLKPGGLLFASANTARLAPEKFLSQVHEAIGRSRRRALRELYVPQPPDFPSSRDEPAYLKTLWVRVS
jgi:23S rRNA (cytosine1962-C5)-methyltransferase